jgi:hypothetical protein
LPTPPLAALPPLLLKPVPLPVPLHEADATTIAVTYASNAQK